MSGFDILRVDRKDFINLRERRGKYVVKQYLHRWGIYDGESVFVKFRKKHNRSFEEVCAHQFIVDEIKVFFELKKMGTRIVFDKTEGYGIMLKWHKNLGTVKQRELMPQWVSDENLFELLKIVFYDVIIGSLDRHGNNVIVLMDLSLLTIDDEDVFYDSPRTLVKFDNDIRKMMYVEYLRSRKEIFKYIDEVLKNSDKILSIVDKDIMKVEGRNFYSIIEKNLKNAHALFDKVVLDLLR